MRRPRFVRFRWLFDGVWRRFSYFFMIFLWFCLVLGGFSIGKRALVDDLGPVCGGQVLPTRPFSVSPEKREWLSSQVRLRVGLEGAVLLASMRRRLEATEMNGNGRVQEENARKNMKKHCFSCFTVNVRDVLEAFQGVWRRIGHQPRLRAERHRSFTTACRERPWHLTTIHFHPFPMWF